MSTRSQIGFYEDAPKIIDNPEALIYRHSDGYPSAVLPDIMPFLSWWSKGRGIDDIEYCSARLLQYLCNKNDAASREYAQDYPHVRNEYSDEFTGTLGHGISKIFHWDIEYYYAITPKGVEVHEVGTRVPNTKKIGLIPYEKYESNAAYKRLVNEE